MVVNKKAFRKLDDTTKATVLKAAEAAEMRGWDMSKEETATKTKIMADNGMIIVTPSKELMDGLQKIGADMLVDWKTKAGADGEELLKAYK